MRGLLKPTIRMPTQLPSTWLSRTSPLGAFLKYMPIPLAAVDAVAVAAVAGHDGLGVARVADVQAALAVLVHEIVDETEARDEEGDHAVAAVPAQIALRDRDVGRVRHLDAEPREASHEQAAHAGAGDRLAEAVVELAEDADAGDLAELVALRLARRCGWLEDGACGTRAPAAQRQVILGDEQVLAVD